MLILKIKCSDGKVRKHIQIECLLCKKTVISRIRKNSVNKYCSAKCAAEHQKKSIELECRYCKVKFKRKPSQLKNSKSKIYFCSRKCKDIGQKLENGITEIHPSHYGTKINGYEQVEYRKIWIESYKQEPSCERCGYNEFASSVHIHHIDENKNNNTLENLIALCANCHFAIHHNNWDIKEIRASKSQS